MNDMTILHLSDLHIDDSGSKYSRLLELLLEDIRKEVSYVENHSLIVVVTGDILHQAPKARDNHKTIDHAKSFFEDLRNVLGKKVVNIYIVPGNHDKYRTEENKFLISAYRSMDEDSLASSEKEYTKKKKSRFDDTFYQRFWKFHLESYQEEKGSGYLELTHEIYKTFGISEDTINSKTYINDTFGVDVLEVLGKKYCFVLLNTAWSCINEEDNRNLILGQFQIDKVKKQFSDIMTNCSKNDRPAVTIVLGHHPMNALRGKEEDRIFTEMISFESLDANVYLCGHTHDRTVTNWVNNRHSLNTFVTGIGWPENQSGSHVGIHTYSMYVFNLDVNSIDVFVKSTDDSGNFIPDYRIYTNDPLVDNRKIYYPIKAQEAQTYVPISGGNRSAKAFYISKEFMCYIKQYVKKIANIRAVVEVLIENDKNTLFDNLEFQDDNQDSDEILLNYLFFQSTSDMNEDIKKDIKKEFHKNDELLYDMFLGFITQLCQKMQEIFVEDECENDDIVRFYFRFLADKERLRYPCLCTSFPSNINPDDYGVSEMGYGELIEEAYKTGKSLVYSVNKDLTKNQLKAKWKNFITVVPLFEQNNYIKIKKRSKTKYPYITFGVTTNNEKFDRMLYCMDYFDIKESLEEIIDEYLQIFDINISDFCDWAKSALERAIE